MKKILRLCLVFVATIFVLFVASWLSLTVPPKPDISKTVLVDGVVEGIWAHVETGDISFRLRGNNDFLYINCGLQAKIDTGALKALLMNKPVSIHVYNGGLDLFNIKSGNSGHICQLQLLDSVVYSEF